MALVATIILNRNLPEQTDALYERFADQNNGETDLYVVESGSRQDKISKYCSFWANWDEAVRDGLRYPRGFNYGLEQILHSGKFYDYQYYFLVCNDIRFTDPLIPVLLEEMKRHPKVGILSPVGRDWAERSLIGERGLKYCWHINHIAWFLRREFIESIMARRDVNFMNFLYDGLNFRGYCADLELVIKGYVNEFATAVTTSVEIDEDVDILREKSDLIQTDTYNVNRRRVLSEGLEWMFHKYGFSSQLQMQHYARTFFDRFFHLYPDLSQHKL
ncbi:MAG: hypothetical protein HQ481_04100 [Alphaproteobacteria bacterium]|nr:hypothetical protein [Alphaproteobacteria bacterium]